DSGRLVCKSAPGGELHERSIAAEWSGPRSRCSREQSDGRRHVGWPRGSTSRSPRPSWAGRVCDRRLVHSLRRAARRGTGRGRDGSLPLASCMLQPAHGRGDCGAGAAGFAAAEMLRRECFGGTITLLSADESAPYYRPNLSKDYLAGNAREEWMPLRPLEFYVE